MRVKTNSALKFLTYFTKMYYFFKVTMKDHSGGATETDHLTDHSTTKEEICLYWPWMWSLRGQQWCKETKFKCFNYCSYCIAQITVKSFF